MEDQTRQLSEINVAIIFNEIYETSSLFCVKIALYPVA